MWTWEHERRREHREGAALLGRVTLGGDHPAANAGGERRWLTLCTPGGYSWRPAEGEQVLILKADGGGEVPCLLGSVEETDGLKPGQVRLKGGACVLLLGDTLELTGEVILNGEKLEDYIRRVASGG